MNPKPCYCESSSTAFDFPKGGEMTRLTVTLDESEREAIRKLAQDERRDTRAQAALLIRESLERLGLLESRRVSVSAVRQASGAEHANAN